MKTTDRKASPSKDLTPVAGERQRIFASAAAAPESQEVRRSSKIPRSPDSRFAASLPGLEKRKRPAARAEKQRGAGKETAQGQESMPNENLQRPVTRSESRRKNTGKGTRNRAHPAFPPRAKATGLKTSTPQSLPKEYNDGEHDGQVGKCAGSMRRLPLSPTSSARRSVNNKVV